LITNDLQRFGNHHFQARGPGAGQSCSNRDLLTEISAMGIQLAALDRVKLKTSASVSARIGPRTRKSVLKQTVA